MENKLKKEEIYVAVSNKKQAKQFKAILLTLGEEINHNYWLDGYSYDQTHLTFHGDWCVTTAYFQPKEITIKQLIELLVTPNEVEKMNKPIETLIKFPLSFRSAVISNNKVKLYYKNEAKIELQSSDIELIYNTLKKL